MLFLKVKYIRLNDTSSLGFGVIPYWENLLPISEINL